MLEIHEKRPRSSSMNYIAALLSPSKKISICHTHTHPCLHLFQLRLLQRRMMHDAWSMFHSPWCVIVASLVNYVPTTSLETYIAKAADPSMLCQQNVKTMYFKTLNPRPFNLRQWFEVRFFSVVIWKCCKLIFNEFARPVHLGIFWVKKKKQIQGICLITINNLTLRVHLFLRQFF